MQIILLTFLLIKSSICSEIMDPRSQDKKYLSEFCPWQKYCKEGTHVVCMYYDHEHEFGPRCGNAVRTEITPKMIQSILQHVNNMRGKISSGLERGKDNKLLPRAYGMMKMKWDEELATLAKVLANQCMGGREDTCRATEKFPNPSQSIAIVHFKYPNWDLPDLNLKYYLKLIRGGATHIGCGISAYSKYKVDGQTESIQNSVQVVCNISEGPQSGEPVYNTDPPIPGQGLTKRCGCPKGYKETRNCLCERVSDEWI
ncbi:hypothetical protein HW555_009804, partial [Spodoptera exigua]